MNAHEAKAGTLLVRTNDQDQLRPVPMLATDVTINVTGIVSRSVVTQHFKNPTDQWLEGIYVFPLPDTAAVDTLSMKIGERVIIGEIKERKQAKKIYEQAKSQGKKASLLEQERPNIFTTSVANIGPGEVIAVTIEYQETMRYDSGKFSLRRSSPLDTYPALKPLRDLRARVGPRTPTRLMMPPELPPIT